MGDMYTDFATVEAIGLGVEGRPAAIVSFGGKRWILVGISKAGLQQGDELALTASLVRDQVLHAEQVELLSAGDNRAMIAGRVIGMTLQPNRDVILRVEVSEAAGPAVYTVHGPICRRVSTGQRVRFVGELTGERELLADGALPVRDRQREVCG